MKDLQGFWGKCKIVLEESEGPSKFLNAMFMAQDTMYHGNLTSPQVDM